jgi:predicted AlkP superfamily pyrophosphatase or phosphodiesterase
VIRNLFQIFLASILLIGCNASATETSSASTLHAKEVREPVTILISIDGFRPDYLERGLTPNLSALAANGIHSAMFSSFPTKTFPNHWTIVTGQTPDQHGIVGNTMEDSARPGERFTMASKDPFWWGVAEPIWITAEKQGIQTATMFWPGSEVEFDGVRPSNWWPFSQQLSNDRRISAVLDWMRRPTAIRPKLVTLYFDTVDTAGHFYGPAPGDKLHAAIRAVDENIGQLMNGLAALEQPVNFVIISDHGMAETSPERVIYLDDILPRDQYRLIVGGNYAGFEPLEGEDLSTLRTAFIKKHKNMKCWEKGNIPDSYGYGKNARVPSIICLPDSGWVAYQDKPEWMTGIGGGHGYDHMHPDMAAFFLANGPDIIGRGKIAKFRNVAIYSLLAQLTGIQANASAGSLTPFSEALAP